MPFRSGRTGWDLRARRPLGRPRRGPPARTRRSPSPGCRRSRGSQTPRGARPARRGRRSPCLSAAAGRAGTFARAVRWGDRAGVLRHARVGAPAPAAAALAARKHHGALVGRAEAGARHAFPQRPDGLGPSRAQSARKYHGIPVIAVERVPSHVLIYYVRIMKTDYNALQPCF